MLAALINSKSKCYDIKLMIAIVIQLFNAIIIIIIFDVMLINNLLKCVIVKWGTICDTIYDSISAQKCMLSYLVWWL